MYDIIISNPDGKDGGTSVLKDNARKYYLEQDYNCAESTIRLANDFYGLDLDEDSMKMVAGFGGGLGCEKTCGALCASIAVLGKLLVKERAHTAKGFSAKCGDYVDHFLKILGSTECNVLKEKYKTDAERCLKTVELNADLLEAYLSEECGITEKDG